MTQFTSPHSAVTHSANSQTSHCTNPQLTHSTSSAATHSAESPSTYSQAANVLAKRPQTTELVFILDRSGSMEGLEKDTIGGFDSMLKKQRNEPGNALVSTVLFDDRIEVIHDRMSLTDVPDLTEKDYYVRGCTALLDAVGGAIHHIGNVHKYARKEDVPEKTLFIITTDGMENASRRYTYKKVRHMIERQKKRYGWEFIFLGANIDAAAEARQFGIDTSMAANYTHDAIGTAFHYEAISNAITNVRTCCGPLTDSWKKGVEADYQKRGGIFRAKKRQ